MRLSTVRRPAGALLLLACVLDAQAAGFDCAKASSVSERAICGDAKLRRLDATLAEAYANVLAAAPDQADMEALEELRQAVEAARRTNPDLPLEKAIERLRITTGTTAFSKERDERNPDAPARLPKTRPSGVSEAEWRALLASKLDKIDEGGEDFDTSYMLLDVDGDGLRDLVIDTKTGGTGEYHSFDVLRQTGGRFVVPGPSKGQPDASFLYALSDRPNPNSAEWIRLRGRAYVAYGDGEYGVDRIDLLRPWSGRGQVPRLTVRYRYRLSVPAIQEIGGRPARRLEPALQRALNEAVSLVTPVATPVAVPAYATAPARRPTPICPLPAEGANDPDAYLSYGPGHYSFEIVDDVPVRIKGQCYIGQVRDFYGSYTPGKGLGGSICIRKPEESIPDPEDCYDVRGSRSVIGIGARALPSGIRD
jgi:hypothetical protein